MDRNEKNNFREFLKVNTPKTIAELKKQNETIIEDLKEVINLTEKYKFARRADNNYQPQDMNDACQKTKNVLNECLKDIDYNSIDIKNSGENEILQKLGGENKKLRETVEDLLNRCEMITGSNFANSEGAEIMEDIKNRASSVVDKINEAKASKRKLQEEIEQTEDSGLDRDGDGGRKEKSTLDIGKIFVSHRKSY